MHSASLFNLWHLYSSVRVACLINRAPTLRKDQAVQMLDYTKTDETQLPVTVSGCEVCLTVAFVRSALT